MSPDRKRVEVLDQDVMGDFNFKGAGNLTGRIVNLPRGDWRWAIVLYARNPQPEALKMWESILPFHENGSAPVRAAQPNDNGEFLFRSLPPDSYTLAYYSNYRNLAEETLTTVLTDFVVPGDGSDVNLGEISAE